MSKQPYDGYVLNVVRMYPRLKDLENPTLKQAFWRRAVEEAISETRQLPDGTERLKVADLLFWKRTHTMDGVALKLRMSDRTVRRRRAAFLHLVEKNLIIF